MSELPNRIETDPGNFRDIHDAVELAFWGIELAPGDPTTLPIRFDQSSQVHLLQERSAQGYDAEHESSVEVRQIKCVLEEGHIMTPQNLVMICWGEYFKIVLDLREENILYIAPLSDKPLDEPTLRRRAKIGLAAVDSILD